MGHSVRWTCAAAILSAGLVLLAIPPFDLWPLGLVALVPLLLLLRSSPVWAAGAAGWVFGVVVNLGGHYWGVDLLQRFAKLPPVAGAAAMIAGCAYQGLVWACWAGLVSYLCRRRCSWFVVAPLALVICEATMPLLFPWQLALVVWRAWPLTQIAEVGGPYAVSALVVLINLALTETLLRLAGPRRLREPGTLAMTSTRPLIRAWVTIALLVGLGMLRALHVSSASSRAPRLRVGLMQPNLGLVSAEIRGRRGEDQIDRMRAASASLIQSGAELLIWPESSFPYLLDRKLTREPAQGTSWQLRPRSNARLLLGASTSPFDASGSYDPSAAVYNSAILFAANGDVRGIYDKLHPLAFGEYIPLAETFPGWAARLRQRLGNPPTVAPGDAPALLVDGELRIAALICYEDLLPRVVHRLARLRPNLLASLANHAWFRDSAAARQALALSTFRSIEARRYLLRSTNTGVSSIGDALGRIVVRGPLHDVDVDHPPPPTLLRGEVRLLELFALGPYLAPLFPWLCGLGLVAYLWLSRNAHPPRPALQAELVSVADTRGGR